MKLHPKIAELLLNLKQDAKQLKRQALACINNIDTVYTSPHRTKARDRGIDENIFHESLSEVVEAENICEFLFNTINNKNMDVTKTHVAIKNGIYVISSRMYRNLWYMSLSSKDCYNFRKLLNSLSKISVWEDEPAKSYTYVKNSMFSGVIAFMHCYGVSFIEYNKGVTTNNAWTVLQDTVERAVRISEDSFKTAKSFMMP